MADVDGASKPPESGAKKPPQGVPPAKSASSKTPPKKQAVVSKSAIVVLIVAVIGVMSVAWFKDNIVSYWSMKPWDKASPCAFVDSVNEALKANDAAALKTLLGGDGATVNVEDGKVTTIKPATAPPQMPPMDARPFVFGGKAEDGEVVFKIDPVRPSVSVSVGTESGQKAIFSLVPAKHGGWSLGQLMVSPK